MPVMRLLFVFLLALNLLAFAAIQGWLGTSESTTGEPERLANQLHPERIRLQTQLPAKTVAAPRPAPAKPTAAAPSPSTTPDPAPAPSPAPAAAGAPACLALAGLSISEADALAGGIAQDTFTVTRSSGPSPTPNAWWVRVAPSPNRETADRRIKELRAQGVTDLFLIQENGPNRLAISLGLFRNEQAARQLAASLRDKGIKGVDVVPRNTNVHRLEIRGPAELLSTLAAELATSAPNAERSECRP